MLKLKALLIPLVFLFSVHCPAEPLRIGYIGALSGDAAAIGSEIAKSLEVSVAALNEIGGINGRSVELVVDDDGYQISRALTAYEKMKNSISSRVIFMSTYGALFALGKRPEKDGIVIVDTLDCNDDLVKVSAMHTCVASRTESIGENFVRSTRENGGGLVGLLYEEEAWFNFIVSTMRKGLRSDLVEAVAPVQATDYRAELTRLKGRNVKHIVFLGNDSMGRAMSQARELGISAPYYSIASVMSPGFQKLAGAALEGTIVSNWYAPRNVHFRYFAGIFQIKHNQPVQLEFVAGPSADAVRLVADTLSKVLLIEDPPSAASIRRELPLQLPFEGVSGTIKMDSDGAVRTILETLFRYHDGTLLIS